MYSNSEDESALWVERFAVGVCDFELVLKGTNASVQGVLWHKDGEQKRAGSASGTMSEVKATLAKVASEVSTLHSKELVTSTPERFENEKGKKAVRSTRLMRSTHCAACKTPLHSGYFECTDCSGIICPRCLLCGCGISRWQFRDATQRDDPSN